MTKAPGTNMSFCCNPTAGAAANCEHDTRIRRAERDYPPHYVPQHQPFPSQQYGVGSVNPREHPHSAILPPLFQITFQLQ